jgi:hypothetical protein
VDRQIGAACGGDGGCLVELGGARAARACLDLQLQVVAERGQNDRGVACARVAVAAADRAVGVADEPRVVAAGVGARAADEAGPQQDEAGVEQGFVAEVVAGHKRLTTEGTEDTEADTERLDGELLPSHVPVPT